MVFDQFIRPERIESLYPLDHRIGDNIIHIVTTLLLRTVPRTGKCRLTHSVMRITIDERINRPGHIALLEKDHQRIFGPPGIPNAVMIIQMRHVALPAGIVTRPVARHDMTVVKGRIKQLLLLGRDTSDTYFTQRAVPDTFGIGADRIETAADGLLFQKSERITGIFKRNPDIQPHVFHTVRQTDLRIQRFLSTVGNLHFARSNVQLYSKIHLIGKLAAEPAVIASESRQQGFPGIVTDFAALKTPTDERYDVLGQIMSDVQQDMLIVTPRKGHPVHRAMMGRGDFSPDSIPVERHAVIIRCRLFVRLRRVVPLLRRIKSYLGREEYLSVTPPTCS